jgi:hypothetical protein
MEEDKMLSKLKLLFPAIVLALLPLISHAKGSDGLVILKGTIRDASTNADVVSFAFTGKLSFTFFTAANEDPTRKRIDLELDVKKLPIRIPKFGTAEYDSKDDPYIVSFRNAAKHASEVSRSGEAVTVALFRPKLSYDIGGVIEKVECTHAQVMPDRLERVLRTPAAP